MSKAPLTLDGFLSRYDGASEDQKQVALEAAVAALDGKQLDSEPLLSLREVSLALGFKDHTSLHKLRVQCVGLRVTPGGRLRYRLSEVRRYLSSPEAQAAREELRRILKHRKRMKA